MLSLTTLRPGNWLLDNTFGCYCSIITVSERFLVERFKHGSYEPILFKLEGIPIIRDNLTLAQFNLTPENLYVLEYNSIIMLIEPQSTKTFSWYVDREFIKDIQYVHELQNAYEDATGQTLELNMFGAKH